MIEIYIHYITKYTHYVDKIIIDGKVVSKFEGEIGKVDLSPLQPYTGELAKVTTTRSYGYSTEYIARIGITEDVSYGTIIRLEELDNMILRVNANDYSKAEKLLKENNIEFSSFDNAYQAVCNEEIDISLSTENVSEQTAVNLLDKLTEELYNSKGTEDVFQRLAEEAADVVQRNL